MSIAEITVVGEDSQLALSERKPSIEAYRGGKNSINVSPVNMIFRQKKIVTTRIKEELLKSFSIIVTSFLTFKNIKKRIFLFVLFVYVRVILNLKFFLRYLPHLQIWGVLYYQNYS